MNAENLEESARAWAIRVRDPAFADWDALSAWLEADPAHLEAYDDAVDDEDWAADVLSTPVPKPLEFTALPDPRPTRRRVLQWGGGAIAASVAAMTGWVSLRGDGRQEIMTAAGERRIVNLADGSRVIMNGSTRLWIHEDRPREVELAGGEALFDVRHDETDPFVVITGKTRLVDAGTIFNVIDRGGGLDVAVAHGAVIYGASGRSIRLDVGQGLSRASADAEPVLRTVAPRSIGSWQKNYLEYAAATLKEIAEDLSRNLGTRVEVQGGSGERFSGTLQLDGPPDQVLARLAPLLAVRFERAGDGWRMIPANAQPR